MANIEFSKLGSAILKNKALTSYMVKRLSNLTAAEQAAGYIEIKFKRPDNENIQTMKVVIGPVQTLQPA